jgi:hypothetical protein
MFNTNKVFEHLITPEQQSVAILGDGKTKLPIEGFGTAKIYVDGAPIKLENSAYVPDLEVSLYSILEHAHQQGTALYCEGGKHKLTWSNTSIYADAGTELTLIATLSPCSPENILIRRASTMLKESAPSPPHVIPPEEDEDTKTTSPPVITPNLSSESPSKEPQDNLSQNNANVITPPTSPKLTPCPTSPTSIMELSPMPLAPPTTEHTTTPHQSDPSPTAPPAESLPTHTRSNGPVNI